MSCFKTLRATARTGRLLLAAIAAFAALMIPAGAASAAQPASTFPDYCLGQCNDILPPGANGNATLVDILGHKALGTRPANFVDQLPPYSNLIQGYQSLANSGLGSYFGDGSFGFPSAPVNKTVKPRSDVTINYDQYGVPHIYGTTRAGTEFGAGWAGAQARLFVMDAFRHLGKGKLSSFAGGAAGNRAQEQNLWQVAPYTQEDLDAQVTALEGEGMRGAQLRADVDAYLEGVNAYIDQSITQDNYPGEYVVTGNGKPKHFTETDLIAIADVIGGLFGNGGGQEMQSALVKIASESKYGAAQGAQVWSALREQEDPEATTTIHNGAQFPYSQAPANTTSVAMPDAGSVTPAPIISAGAGASASAADSSSSTLAGLASLPLAGSTDAKSGMSNALVVSGTGTTDGHPVAVMGPQTGYFSPQLLIQQELQGPGISARGVGFAGLNFYVQIGRGPSYAWSPTSSEHDMTDTYAVTLCEPGGGTPTTKSNHYLYRGDCIAMTPLSVDNSWSPTLADSTAAGSYTMTTYRTKYGLVSFRGKVAGKPTAFTVLRSTYLHDADSVIGFQMFNDPNLMSTADGFKTAASNIDYAFNWFYVNSKDAAYFDSGRNPVRAPETDPNLPIKAEAKYEWPGFNPADNTSQLAPVSEHPNSVNQDYYVSWNNKQAPGFSAADGNFSFGSVQRVDLLDKPIKTALAGGQKFDRAKLTAVMEEAAVTDMRAKEVLPELIAVLTSQSVTNPVQQQTVAELQAWLASGAKRVESSAGSKVYAYQHAIQVFDAWWPLLVEAQFKGTMGPELYQSVVNAMQINESPSGGQQGQTSTLGGPSSNQAQTHKGSSFQYGWWGYVDKDLRSILGRPVQGRFPVTFCGNGNLAACRSALLASLDTAVGQTPAQIYPADSICSAGDQWCADAINQSPLGGINDPLISWQNRPTYQQVVSFPAAFGDNVSNLALKKSVSATSYNRGLLGLLAKPPSFAVDGDPTTYWESASSNTQSITVDLGSTQSVARAIVRWGGGPAAKYTVQVSTNNSTWTTVATVTAGKGGVENHPFTARSARYVRIAGTARQNTSKGYSINELEVYGR
ncbi:MAG: penicillin acylase family protein [Thermoleophilaceae bacterium]|nr:penicillin acylase family protein [Thermoleophilaceae bacterium]